MHGRGNPIASADDDAKDLIAVQQTLRGDIKAFSDIVDRYTPVLYSLTLRMLGSREESEDLVQDIFLSIYKSLGSFKIGARFYSWMYTIAINAIRTRLRKERRSGASRHARLDSENPPQIEDRRINVELQVVTETEEERAEKAISLLKPAYKIVFVLRFVEGHSLKEISDLLHMPIGTVKAKIHRARKRLIELLTADDDGQASRNTKAAHPQAVDHSTTGK